MLTISLSAVEVQHLTALGTLPGVRVLLAAAHNGVGAGRITYWPSPSRLFWVPPNCDDSGPPVEVADGEFTLEGPDPADWIRVQVYEDYLPSDYSDEQVHLSDRYTNAVADADVTAAEAAAGDVATWTVDLINESDLPLLHLRAWLDAAVEHLEISFDGSTWAAPTTEETALEAASLAPSATQVLSLRRTIPASHGPEPAMLNLIHLSFSQL